MFGTQVFSQAPVWNPGRMAENPMAEAMQSYSSPDTLQRYMSAPSFGRRAVQPYPPSSARTSTSVDFPGPYPSSLTSKVNNVTGQVSFPTLSQLPPHTYTVRNEASSVGSQSVAAQGAWKAAVEPALSSPLPPTYLPPARPANYYPQTPAQLQNPTLWQGSTPGNRTSSTSSSTWPAVSNYAYNGLTDYRRPSTAHPSFSARLPTGQTSTLITSQPQDPFSTSSNIQFSTSVPANNSSSAVNSNLRRSTSYPPKVEDPWKGSPFDPPTPPPRKFKMPANYGPPLPANIAKIIAQSRASGSCNLSSKGLNYIPSAVWNPDVELPVGAGDLKWWEITGLSKLDVSRNELTTLPPELAAIDTLTHLDVSHNHLQVLPPDIAGITALRLLDVSDNQLSQLPDELANLASLGALTCSNNKLTSLPPRLGARQPNLSMINASNNQIQEVPSGLANCRGLRKVDLKNNRISALPANVCDALRSCLTELDISHNQFNGILPPEIGRLASLKLLWAQDNRLLAVPPEIVGCTDLVELHLGGNLINSLPPNIGAMQRLKTLELRANRLQELPLSICDLQLNLLDLTDNDLGNLPPQLGFMNTLRALPLDGNPIKSIRSEVVHGPVSGLLKLLRSRVGEPNQGPLQSRSAVRSGNVFGEDEAELAAETARKLAMSQAQGSHELVLKGTGITQVPFEVWKAAEVLVKLDLSENQIPSSSIEVGAIAKMRFIREINFSSMPLTSWPLPSEHGVLQGLSVFDISNCRDLKVIPIEAFACCPNLRNLNLSGVPSVAVMHSGTFTILTQLNTLDVSFCGLTGLPPDVEELPSLRVLNLRNNRIVRLPEDIWKMRKLEELDVVNNDLTGLPLSMCRMSGTLLALKLEGNPLRSIRRSVLEKGTAAVLQYLADKLPQPQQA